ALWHGISADRNGDQYTHSFADGPPAVPDAGTDAPADAAADRRDRLRVHPLCREEHGRPDGARHRRPEPGTPTHDNARARPGDDRGRYPRYGARAGSRGTIAQWTSRRCNDQRDRIII